MKMLAHLARTVIREPSFWAFATVRVPNSLIDISYIDIWGRIHVYHILKRVVPIAFGCQAKGFHARIHFVRVRMHDAIQMCVVRIMFPYTTFVCIMQWKMQCSGSSYDRADDD